jgi:hypothetical protein
MKNGGADDEEDTEEDVLAPALLIFPGNQITIVVVSS